MGCSASKGAVVVKESFNSIYAEDVNKVWTIVNKKANSKKSRKKLVVKRTGWKTIRIFVSSTFKDFHAEREILVKKVFPELRAWCEPRRLYLVDCDLRWVDIIYKHCFIRLQRQGVLADSTTDATLRACLGEIDRCKQDNIMPFFINMTSERVGWIPEEDEVPEALQIQYDWINGLSVTEMEIMHAAYHSDNPNALFLLRSKEFIDSIPEEYHPIFVDKNPKAPAKLHALKKNISSRFNSSVVKKYHCKFAGFNPDSKMVELSGLDGQFATTVFEFFKERIAEQYPLATMQTDIYQHRKEAHESFMKSRCESVLGRDTILQQIDEYVCGVANDKPLLLVGGPGSGKSSIMTRVADVAVTKAASGTLPGGGERGWHVFYHFVGAVPGSTELKLLLRRLLMEMQAVNEGDLPKDLESAASVTLGTLANPASRPTVVIVDAINQLDEEDAAKLCTWVPKKLAPQIRVVLSMIPGTHQHKTLIEHREPLPIVFEVGPLDRESRQLIVEDTLDRYTKKLSDKQMSCLLEKKSSENPLWLSIACEELRVFGNFRQVDEKIAELADDLLGLEMQILDRFERENGGDTFVATLCLLEVSARGMLETELLFILGELENRGSDDEKDLDTEKEGQKSKQAETKDKEKSIENENKEEDDGTEEQRDNAAAGAKGPNLQPGADLDFESRSGETLANRTKYNTTQEALANAIVTSEGNNGAAKKTFTPLVAYKWSEVYRALRPFLRPFGESGEGRLDFYHRSLSKAVRRKYFQLEDGSDHVDHYKKWHKELADFFETVTNIERKTEELPTHLVALADSERLESLLTDWKIFSLLFEEEHSSKLIDFWRKTCDFKRMETLYVEQVHNWENDVSVTRDEFSVRLEKMARFLAQGGRYEKAKELSEKARGIEETELGARSERLMEYYLLTGFVLDEMMKLEEYMYRSQLPRMKEIIQNFEASVKIRQEFNDEKNKTKLGITLNRMGFYYSGYCLRGGDEWLGADEAKDKGMAVVQRAIDLFTEVRDHLLKPTSYLVMLQLGDDIHVGDSLTTKGVVYGRSCPEQIKCYQEALSKIKAAAGELHHFLDRLYLNVGIYYEELGDYYKAYEYFKQWYELEVDLIGRDHPRTQRCINTLREPMYRRIAQEKGNDVPEPLEK